MLRAAGAIHAHSADQLARGNADGACDTDTHVDTGEHDAGHMLVSVYRGAGLHGSHTKTVAMVVVATVAAAVAVAAVAVGAVAVAAVVSEAEPRGHWVSHAHAREIATSP